MGTTTSKGKLNQPLELLERVRYQSDTNFSRSYLGVLKIPVYGHKTREIGNDQNATSILKSQEPSIIHKDRRGIRNLWESNTSTL